MTAEEFIINKWNSCIWMTHEDHPKNIIMVYDPTFIRQKKLNSLFDKDIELVFHKTDNSEVYFVQNYKSDYFDVNYPKIWSILENKYGLKYDDIQSLIKKTLLDDNKLNVLTPFFTLSIKILLLLDDNKLNVLTPYKLGRALYHILLDDNKLNVLTPYFAFLTNQYLLLEDNKLKII